MKKTNKELNTAHDARMAERVRPAPKEYDWAELEAIMHAWQKATPQSV
jgi:hypothetical protein